MALNIPVDGVRGKHEMDKRIITVSREFGSGGRSIAKELANRLGWKYYYKELVKQVADETGFSPEFIE